MMANGLFYANPPEGGLHRPTAEWCVALCNAVAARWLARGEFGRSRGAAVAAEIIHAVLADTDPEWCQRAPRTYHGEGDG